MKILKKRGVVKSLGVDHVAILRKASFSENVLADILTGRKTIESRWYVNKIAPWARIFPGDTVYFKESGCSVTARANVSEVLQYDNINTESVKEIVTNYGKQIAPHLSKEDFLTWAHNHSHKNYCIMIFLESVTKIPPFDINKQGFGSASAWLVVENIDKIKANA